MSLADMLTFARHILERSARRTLVTLYWPELDSVAHARGPDSDAYEAELQSFDDALRRELVGRIDRTLLVLSSDHGFVTMEPEDYRSLVQPARPPRAPPLEPGRRAAGQLPVPAPDKAAPPHGHFPPAFDDGLVALDARHRPSTPDFSAPACRTPRSDRGSETSLVVSTGRDGLYHPYPDSPFLRGMHGGLTEDELYVPLFVSPLS